MKDSKRNKKQGEKISTLLTASEVARIFNVHISTIRRWSERGILRPYFIAPRGARRFRREDVAVAYLDKAIQKYMKNKSD